MVRHEFVTSRAGGVRVGVWSVVLSLSALGLRAAPPSGHAATQCARAPARQWQVGEVVTIRGASRTTCTAVFRGSAVQLIPDGRNVDGVSEYSVSRDRRGRFYTSDGRGGVAVWAPDGTWLRSFGSIGGGPGELARGALTIHAAPDNMVYVLDNSRRWSVFDSVYRFVDSDALGIGLGPRETAALDDGTLLDAVRPGGNVSFAIRSWNRSLSQRGGQTAGTPALSNVVRTFGELRPSEARIAVTERGRLVAYGQGSTFWAGPPQATGRGYEVELWTTSGTRLRTIRREVSWYPPGIDIVRQRGSDRQAPPPGEVEQVFDLGADLLWVAIRVTDLPAWREYARAPRDTVLRARAYQIYAEIIDTRSGTVLVSMPRVDVSRAVALYPAGWFNGSGSGYRSIFTPDGEQGLQIVELDLTGT